MTTPRSTISFNGREIARIGLGTNRLNEDDASRAVLRAAIELGYGMIDTADIYTGGMSETVIGDVLAQNPSEIVVATKGAMRPGPDGTAIDGTPAYLTNAIEASLRRLRVEAIDLYYLHKPSETTPIEESVGALRDAQTAGKIKQIGLSNVTVEQIERAQTVAPIAAIQNRYSLLERDSDDAIAFAEANGMIFVPFFPLDRAQPGGSAAVISEIADRTGATAAQVALAWLLRRSPAMLPIPGTRSVAHLKANLAASRIELTPEEIGKLDALGTPA
jgi:aryl-alcohol dehydrogenase-like predicted oxidoreductase